ncbi:zinc-ribbon domain containing protein [Microbulbifer sp. MLAF003]|uniref:zinc-ribbon domain containing protein n=1 Tax=Microbulbifer sp. MLAF003 TaxID=3032582 RepID=UPI0024ADA1C1|nr:zinc-ribbon domain containing protein [Microbulbifer sp. MLAF003]WHI50184.1 zinc-ribbon domain containing protein [Microbulbifer sp. MLAF003]
MQAMVYFFANEQKHWFEGLGFYVDADCIKCVDCRKNDQNIKLMQKRYQILSVKKDRNAKEASELKGIALELFQLGYIKDLSKVNRIG